VKAWYDEHGSGDPLVLMHGGLVDARFFEPNLGPLAERFHVYMPERRGHGHTPDVPGNEPVQTVAAIRRAQPPSGTPAAANASRLRDAIG
jgi:pimeloyl-ACP methyl ester carboxylesterase